MRLPKPNSIQGAKYVAGLSLFKRKLVKIKLSANESALGPSPKADWIGWHKDVSINDIKVKYVSSLGEDVHDYDMWNSQVRNVSRKPYLEDSELFMYNGYGLNRKSIRNKILRGSSVDAIDGSGYLFNTSKAHGEVSRSHISYSDSRNQEILQMMYSQIGG